MDRLTRTRRLHRRAVERFIAEIKVELEKEELNAAAVKTKMERLDESHEEILNLDQRIIDGMLDADATDEDMDLEMQNAEEVKNSITAIKLAVDQVLKPASRAGSPAPSEAFETASGLSTKRNYKLPKIEIKKFDGDLKNWLGFWAQFQKIHDDEELHEADKFQYLAQSMVTGSRAQKLLNSYPQSTANYPKVVQALKERFGDKDLLTEVYVRELLGLVLTNFGKKDWSLSSMYDDLETQLRGLESLGVTTQQSAVFLYPLVESSLPEDLIKIWQRSAESGYGEEGETTAEDRLKSLMHFLKKEVKGNERLNLVKSSLSDSKEPKYSSRQQQPAMKKERIPTAAGLHVSDNKCVFCDRGHESRECIKAQSMSLEDKRSCIQKKKCCYLCLRSGHLSKTCKVAVKCIVCGQKHPVIMCPQVRNQQQQPTSNDKAETSASNLACSSQVILKTLMVIVTGSKGAKRVRALLDDGSQRSYVLASLAEELGLRVNGQQQLIHSLFGGTRTHAQDHKQYEVELRQVNGNGRCTFTALDQRKICGTIPRMTASGWMNELKSKNIWVSDVGGGTQEISLLLGADILGQLVTGRICQLQNGLTALETKLGWTIMGKCNSNSNSDSSIAMTVTNLSILDSSVEQLWKLDAIGITDPADHKSAAENELAVKEHFLETVYRTPDGRYGVKLPWVDGAQRIPTNRDIAERRLQSMTKRLVATGHYSTYDDMFKSWKAEGIIEEVKEESRNKLVHYLPHRAVIKVESTTTPVRPVFDASCKTGRAPSLNDCLEKGPNLLELIPSILTRFREGKYGVISDIRKAFLMVEMAESDRDFLRFLWWENFDQQKLKVFRHRRVVFGVNSSPYLLAAVIEYHLKNLPPEQKPLATKLLKSLYVDNCVASVDSIQEYEEFKAKSTAIMEDAKMELRLWQTNAVEESGSASVLGLTWNLDDDTLGADFAFDQQELTAITKRKILSCAQRVFDPIGFLSPALLTPKLILQEAWAQKLGWDEELPVEIQEKFLEWCIDLECLKEVKIPRNVTGNVSDHSKWELHTFTDASKLAYSAVVFLRTEQDGEVSLQLVQAKSRVAPTKKVSIPRLELLGCTIGSRLAATVKSALDFDSIPSLYWSDSTTALAWIGRNDEWGTFVGNRVTGICELTNSEDWHHVPGHMNPADLPSRGCSPSALLKSRWWEGPDWLKGPRSGWPSGIPDPDEKEVVAERKKTKTTTLLTKTSGTPWYLGKFSSFHQNVRVIAWMKRAFRKTNKGADLTVEELDAAEMTLLKQVQSEAFAMDSDLVSGIRVMKDENGMLRVKTKLLYRADTVDFRYPILLPHRHAVVDQLIRSAHKMYGHQGIQFLMAKLREKYWIFQARKAIRRVLSTCVICRRFTAKKTEVEPASLPEHRVRDAKPFEVIGVDLAGPLFLKKREKSWIVLFTCAVYRCVHLELVRSLSTASFLEALSRFISRRGRPSIIHSDNGTNFIGTENAFRILDWNKIVAECAIQRITWKFNPPTAAWWGGFWERMVRSVKELLRRVLGRSTVTYDQLHTYLCEIESHINGRPLTTVTEDPEDLAPLTPAMFLHETPCSSFAELDFLTGAGFQEAYTLRKTILGDFKRRFRNEYLGLLVQKGKSQPQSIKVGDVVLVGADGKKRWEWPIAKVMELYPGKDGHVRVAKVKTPSGFLDRPLQRLYQLEVSSFLDPTADGGTSSNPEEEQQSAANIEAPKDVRSRFGRSIKTPHRFGFD